MLRISRTQYSSVSEASNRDFLSDLEELLANSFPELEREVLNSRMLGMVAQCELLGIKTQYGISSYCFVSLLRDRPLVHDADFVSQHRRYVELYGDPDQLSIDLYECIEPGL